MMGPLVFDRDQSTVQIGGSVFPAAQIVCPNTDDQEETEQERSLAGDDTFFVPAENGMLFEVIQSEPNAPAFRRWALTMWLRARTCEFYDDDNVWLPRSVFLRQGELVSLPRRIGRRSGVEWWDDCDHEWVAETILRLSGKPFSPLSGPEVKVVPLSYFGERT